jgi:hypothetical protein
MGNALSRLEEALRIGEIELDRLQAGEVEEAETLARDRGRLLSEALSRREGVSLEELTEKLTQLKRLQGRISSEALQLKSSLREDLKKARRENKRLSGYGGAAKKTPLMQAKYCSKIG